MNASKSETESGPVVGSRMPEGYARAVARFVYIWAWPMVNMHNRHDAMAQVPEPGLMGGIVPVSPLNRLGMLHDYIVPEERYVTCPNQDVVYGLGLQDFGESAVVVQVPDFGDRFWVYQCCDQRSDGYAPLGKMYGTAPGFYLLAGEEWDGVVPEGISEVFRCSTRVGCIIPRVFQSDDPADKAAIQPLINQIDVYPVAEFDGTMKTHDWTALPVFPQATSGDEEVQWVSPADFFATLAAVLDETPALPGEETIYAQARALLDAAAADDSLRALLDDEAEQTNRAVIQPLFEFRNYGTPLPHNWTTLTNNAEFGIDYLSRTAAAKSNMFVNRPQETKYFYQDLDGDGNRLHGSKRYTITFPKGGLPPVQGFWSLTLYNRHHFFHPNELNRYSLGTKNTNLRFDDDGSLTFCVQAEAPGGELDRNWLPAPAEEFSLYLRAYWPEAAILDGTWTPPTVELE